MSRIRKRFHQISIAIVSYCGFETNSNQHELSMSENQKRNSQRKLRKNKFRRRKVKLKRKSLIMTIGHFVQPEILYHTNFFIAKN